MLHFICKKILTSFSHLSVDFIVSRSLGRGTRGSNVVKRIDSKSILERNTIGNGLGRIENSGEIPYIRIEIVIMITIGV